jgi:hypothetical protein
VCYDVDVGREIRSRLGAGGPESAALAAGFSITQAVIDFLVESRNAPAVSSANPRSRRAYLTPRVTR